MPSSLSILVIDHDPALLRVTSARLLAAGFDVDTVTEPGDLSDTGDLIDRLIRFSPALVLLDITLSGDSESGLLVEIRRDARLADIAVVLMCDHRSTSRERAECLDRGADDCLLRTLDDVELTARLRAQLRRRFARASVPLEEHRPAMGNAETDGSKCDGDGRLTFQTVAAREASFRTLVELAPEPIFVQTRGRFAYANAAALRLHGAECAEQLVGRFVVDCCAPEDRETVMERIRLVNEQRLATPTMDRELLTLSGERRIAAISAVPFTFEGEPGALVFARDITERKAAENALAESNKALQLLSHCNEALIRCDDEVELLTEICRMAVELGGFRFAWIGYARNDAARTVEPQAHAGWENGYLSDSVISWAEDRPTGRGPAGCVIRSGQALLWPNLAAESRFEPWAEAALKNGYQGIVCLPLKDGDRVFGVLALYFPAARSPQADEVQLWQELAENLAFGIGNLRSQQERRRIESAVLKMASSVTAVSDEQFFVRLAASMAEAVNAEGGFVARLLPGKRAVARTFAAVVDGQVEANFDYDLEGTPCEHLLESHEVVIESRIAEAFPAVDRLRTLRAQAYVGQRLDNASGQPIGLLFVLFRAPLQRSEWIASTLRIFAARVAAELERIDADARIRQQAALLDKAEDAILVRDLEHRILYWNRRAERLYGWQAEEVAGRSVRELFYGDDDADFLAATEQTCREGEWVGELVQRTKDGRQLTVEGHWTLVRSDDGEPTSILAINTDITARRELEERLRQSQKIEAVGRLAGGIAHDFNNLLTVITGYSELLLSEPAIDETGREFVLAISEAGQRAAVLTRQLLSFGRQSILQPKIIDLNQMVSQIGDMLRRLIGEDILFQTVLEPNLSRVKVDPGQLDQVLVNLAVNARDAMPDGGRLTIETAAVTLTEAEAQSLLDCTPGPYVRLSISDTGCGMPPDIVPQIFEPFFTTKEFGKGTGLGLATVFGIIRQSGGTIGVDSEPGRGTRFQIFLPAIDQL